MFGSLGRMALVAMLGVALASGTASAQRRTPNMVVSPPITNPFVLQAITPRYSAYVPPIYTPPAYGYSPWGPVVYPGTYTPPRVVQSVPGTYYNVPGLGLYNPAAGSIYSPYYNAFSTADGVYSFNPWTGRYTNAWTGGSYNPWRGTVTTPVVGWWGNPWGW
jgi:hypothetical protein